MEEVGFNAGFDDKAKALGDKGSVRFKLGFELEIAPEVEDEVEAEVEVVPFSFEPMIAAKFANFEPDGLCVTLDPVVVA